MTTFLDLARKVFVQSVIGRYAASSSSIEVEKAILYGSRARGDYRNGSDIDLTLCGGGDLTLSVRNRIAVELDDLLLPYMIDLSIFRDISDPDMIAHIQRVGTPVYEKARQSKEEGSTG